MIIPCNMKVRLFNTTCVTVLLYGCESWVLVIDSRDDTNTEPLVFFLASEEEPCK